MNGDIETIIDSCAPHVQRRPSWMTNYKVRGIHQIKYPLTHFAIFYIVIQQIFKVASNMKNGKRRWMMKLQPLKNDKWELADLPLGHKILE